jgi:hypothetical protein
VTYEVSARKSGGTVARATLEAPEKVIRTPPPLFKQRRTVKIMGECGDKADNLQVDNESMKVELVERIMERLGESQGSYVIEARDTRCKLQTEFRIEERWIYKLRRTSQPERHEESLEEETGGEHEERGKTKDEVIKGKPSERERLEALRRKGNQTRPLLNQSSLKAWG